LGIACRRRTNTRWRQENSGVRRTIGGVRRRSTKGGSEVIALTAWTGSLLTVAGLIAYFVTGMASMTALIPAVVGVLLLLAALIGRRPGTARRGAMYAALLVALLGALGSLMNVAQIGDLIAGDVERPAAVIVSIIM